MSNRTTLNIDGAKLNKMLKEKGNLSKMSRELGFSKNYLSVVCNTNKVSVSGANLIDKMLGIPYEAYKPEEPKVEEPKPEPETKIVTRDEMFMKSVLSMLAEICNNQRVMSGKLDEIIRMWGDC